jgi:2-dehydropantoate 2-reductase
MLPPPRIYCALAAGTWTMRWVDHPQLTQRMVWQKLIINLAINPLTALHQVANGALVAAEFQERWRPLVQEACAIGTAAGIDLEATTECERVLNVIQSTAHNHSSMFQDWAQGRPGEIDFVALPFITHARQHGLNPTAIAALYAQVKSQEAAGRHR